jgi:hypothetical protein
MMNDDEKGSQEDTVCAQIEDGVSVKKYVELLLPHTPTTASSSLQIR